MANAEYYCQRAMKQLQQDIIDRNWTAIYKLLRQLPEDTLKEHVESSNDGDWTYELLQQLPEDTLIQYITFEEPSYA